MKLALTNSSLWTTLENDAMWIRLLGRAFAITLGGLHTWAAISSHSMNADGIAYLDIGDAYFSGNWDVAINPVWSPFYSWILGAVMWLVRPDMRWEFPLVQLVNFAIYLFALLCFEYFWNQVKRLQASRWGQHEKILPEWGWHAVGYLLFVWSSLSLIEMWAVTPDMLMSAFVYLAAALFLRFQLGYTSQRAYLIFGVLLGLGFLAKAIMLPVALVFLTVTLFSTKGLRHVFTSTGVAVIAFLAISGSFILMVSSFQGKLTFGDAGTITFVRYVNGLPYPHWQGGPEGFGEPLHPSRQIFDSPPIYEFGTPIGGTYPISQDPFYWYEGVIPRYDLRQITSRMIFSGLFYFDVFGRQLAAVLASLFILYAMGKRPPWRSRPWRTWPIFGEWGLALVALAAFALYAPVYVEGRYIAVFVVLLVANLLANVRLPDASWAQPLAKTLNIVMATFLLLNIVVFNLQGLGDLNARNERPAANAAKLPPPSWPGEVAEALHQTGVEPGDKVAVIGHAFTSFWARLARVQIVAEMLDTDAEAFYRGDAQLQNKIIETFAGTEAIAVVAEHVPPYANLDGWHQVNNSNYFFYLLDP